MRVRLNNRDLSDQKADVAACFAYEGDREPRGVRDAGLRRTLARQMKAEGFRARRGDRLVWHVDGAGSRRYMVVGLGTGDGAPGEAIRAGCAQAARHAAEYKARSLAVKLPPTDGGQAREEIRAAVEGVLLGGYRFDRHLTDPSRREPSIEVLDVAGNGGLTSLRGSVARGQVTGSAVRLARDLVNEAPSILTPRAMARRAAAEARKAGLRSKVLGAAELKRIGMKALLSVSRGSEEPPQVVHLTYRPKQRRRASRRVLLVGKGVTFDSGGLNLKPGPSMLHMKGDMAGAAAVLAAMTTLGEIGCRAEVHGLLGLTENMTGGAAYKPGDILETLSGKTVEVGNTDAEGRLVLCDLLTYGARRIKPDLVIDLATLTGACVVALGSLASGVFSRHAELRDGLLEAGRLAGEKLWPLPMYEEYLQQLQKGPADLCNVGGRWGGAILAALFLGEFVPRELPWAHLDIAGPAFAEQDVADSREGGTGAGVRTLVRWLEGA